MVMLTFLVMPTFGQAVTKIAAGSGHSLFLKSDGSFWGMGDNYYGGLGNGTYYNSTNRPEQIVAGGVTAIAAGGFYSLFLKSDGSLWAMGDNSYGKLGDGTFNNTNRPEQIVASGVTAITAGTEHSLFLKSDGSLWAMGENQYGELGDGTYSTNSPYGTNRPEQIVASGVTAIAAGDYHSLFLKSDGSLWAMGNNGVPGRSDGIFIKTNRPEQIVASGVTAIAAGYQHSLFLKSDGSLWAMGFNYYGQFGDGTYNSTNRPEQITPPVQSAPMIITQPQSQTVQVGSSVMFSVVTSGFPLPNYQWRFNGQSLAGQTATSLSLTNVQFANAGGYSVVVTNAYGSVTSATATLKLLAIDTNNSPRQINPNPLPTIQSGKDSLCIVTHGFIPYGPVQMPAWVSELANAISSKAPSNWQVIALDWSKDAYVLTSDGLSNPELALLNGRINGTLLGQQLSKTNWQQVHLIGHSAGAGLIQAIADILSTSPSNPRIQLTFLDPYTGGFHENQGIYGRNANWSDCYAVEDFTGGFTAGNLAHAYNVDVSWVDPAHQTVPWGLSQVAFSTHEYTHEFYLDTVTNSSPSWCGYGYGYALSQETFLGWTRWGDLLPGNTPLMLCGAANALQNPSPGLASTLVALADANHAISSFGASLLGNTGFLLSSLTQGLLPHDGGPKALTPATNSPGWLAVGLTVTNPVNYIQFDSGFTDTNAAQGLVTVYWDTNQIGMVDERVASTNVQTYRFILPATVTSGSYVLGFRLDAFNNTASSVSITNVAMGFVGVTQPITLNIALTNGVPRLQLTGPSGYSYLVQTSTNLVAWTPTTLLANTNGTVLFVDSAVTNSNRKFYRAMLFSSIVVAPTLQARVSANNFILLWPTNATGYALETTTNLAAVNSWIAVTNVPAIVNLQNVVTNPVSGRARFYRLKK